MPREFWYRRKLILATVDNNFVLATGDVMGTNRTDVGAIAADAVPGGKLVQPSEIASGVLFLASDESGYGSGTELVIDHSFSS